MRFLSNKEKKKLKDELPRGFEIDNKDEIKEDLEILYKNGDKYLIVMGGKYLPHLKSVLDKGFKAVYVDRGAIPFIAKGADLMRPGIHKIDEGILKGDIVLVREQVQNKVIAIGFSLFSSGGLEEQTLGKSVEVYHFVGDQFY